MWGILISLHSRDFFILFYLICVTIRVNVSFVREMQNTCESHECVSVVLSKLTGVILAYLEPESGCRRLP